MKAEVAPPSPRAARAQRYKGAFGLTVLGLAFMLLWPLWLALTALIAAAIRLQYNGPVLYRQVTPIQKYGLTAHICTIERTEIRGENFRIWSRARREPKFIAWNSTPNALRMAFGQHER